MIHPMLQADCKKYAEQEAVYRSFTVSKYADWVEDILGHARGRVLDLGCGDGAHTRPLVGRGLTVISSDLSFSRLAALKTVNPLLAECSAVALPFADACFDTILFIEVLEHLPDRDAQRQALAEFVRLLGPGGRLVLTTPNRPVYRVMIRLWTWFGGQRPDPTHFSELSLDELIALCQPSFDIVALRGKVGLVPVRWLQRLFSRRPGWCYDILLVGAPRR